MTDGLRKAKAGWYPHPKMTDTVRYWDGNQWTGQVAPAPSSQPPAPAAEPAAPASAKKPATKKVPCAYCKEPIAPNAERCPHCAGLFFYCKHDKGLMPVDTKEKFVGLLRGGSKPSHRCKKCGRILAGAKW